LALNFTFLAILAIRKKLSVILGWITIPSLWGVVRDVKMNRKTKEPMFEIHFPLKKYDKKFLGFDLEYIYKYSVDIPIKYHVDKDQHFALIAKAVEANMERKLPAGSVDDENVFVDDESSYLDALEHLSDDDSQMNDAIDDENVPDPISIPPFKQRKKRQTSVSINQKDCLKKPYIYAVQHLTKVIIVRSKKKKKATKSKNTKMRKKNSFLMHKLQPLILRERTFIIWTLICGNLGLCLPVPI
jgi:hypothetical protein